jgi:hypothetical protein
MLIDARRCDSVIERSKCRFVGRDPISHFHFLVFLGCHQSSEFCQDPLDWRPDAKLTEKRKGRFSQSDQNERVREKETLSVLCRFRLASMAFRISSVNPPSPRHGAAVERSSRFALHGCMMHDSRITCSTLTFIVCSFALLY